MEEREAITVPPDRRRRYTPAERDELYQRWIESGLSQKAYEALHGLSQGTLSRWRRRHQQASLSSSDRLTGGQGVFVAAQPPTSMPPPAGQVCWQLPGDGGSVLGTGADVAVTVVGVLRALGNAP